MREWEEHESVSYFIDSYEYVDIKFNYFNIIWAFVCVSVCVCMCYLRKINFLLSYVWTLYGIFYIVNALHTSWCNTLNLYWFSFHIIIIIISIISWCIAYCAQDNMHNCFHLECIHFEWKPFSFCYLIWV